MSAEPTLAERLRAIARVCERDCLASHDAATLRAAADRLDAQQAVIDAAYSVIEADGAGDIGATLFDLANALAALDGGDR